MAKLRLGRVERQPKGVHHRLGWLHLMTFAGIALSTPAAAQAVWGSYGNHVDRFGEPNFTLIYGEGENIFFFAECMRSLPGRVEGNIAMDVGANRAGPTNLYIDVDGHASFGPAEIVDTFDFAGLIPFFTIAADDPLWNRLRDGNRVRFWVENGPWSEITLAGSGAAINLFFSRCETLWATAEPAAVEPPLSAPQPAPPATPTGKTPAAPAEATAAPPAPATEGVGAIDDAIRRYGTSLLASNVFHGDFTGDGEEDAMAFFYYQDDGGGNSFSVDVALFVSDGGVFGPPVFVDGIFGSDPRNVVFGPNRIEVTTSVTRPGDARCCPTGSRTWTIGPTGWGVTNAFDNPV